MYCVHYFHDMVSFTKKNRAELSCLKISHMSQEKIGHMSLPINPLVAGSTDCRIYYCWKNQFQTYL